MWKCVVRTQYHLSCLCESSFLAFQALFFKPSLFVLLLAHVDTSAAAATTAAGPGPGPAPGRCCAAALGQPTAQCCWGHHLSLRCHAHDTDPPVAAHPDCTGEEAKVTAAANKWSMEKLDWILLAFCLLLWIFKSPRNSRRRRHYPSSLSQKQYTCLLIELIL